MNQRFFVGATLLLAVLLLGAGLSLLPRHSAQKIEQALKETTVSELAPEQMAPREVAEALLEEFKSKRPEFSNVKLHFFEYPPKSAWVMSREPRVYNVRGLSFGEAMRAVATQSGTRFIEKPDAIYFYKPPQCEPNLVPPLTGREKFVFDLEGKVRRWTSWFDTP